MPPVYIREQGAVVRRRGERLVVTRNNKQLLDLPLIHLDQLVIFGNVQISTQAIAMLLQAEVDVVFLSQYGTYRGRLVRTGSKNARLRHAQLQKMSDPVVNLAIARQVVVGKLTNQRALLQKNLAGAPSLAALKTNQAAAQIGQALRKAQRAKSVDSLRGFEGSAGAGYWAAFKVLLKHNVKFQGRKYYPPPDPVNALLSFGYSLLLKDVTAAVQLVGLDPYLGFFHVIDYGRPSLALDMMEEFRPVLVDPIVLEMVNQNLVTGDSFERTANTKRPIQLTEVATNQLIERYEGQLERRTHHPGAGGQTRYRRVIELQVRRLAGVIQGQVKHYRPFMVKV